MHYKEWCVCEQQTMHGVVSLRPALRHHVINRELPAKYAVHDVLNQMLCCLQLNMMLDTTWLQSKTAQDVILHSRSQKCRTNAGTAGEGAGMGRGGAKGEGGGVGGGEGGREGGEGRHLWEAVRELRRRCLVLRRSLAILVNSPTVCTIYQSLNVIYSPG